jgi:hypothetical protein
MLGGVQLGTIGWKDGTMTETVTWWNVCQQVREIVAADIESGHLDVTDLDAVDTYATEWADGSEWVIYTHNVMRLWVDSSDVSDYEEHLADYGPLEDDSIVRRMTLCVFLALRDEIETAIREYCEENDIDLA